MLLERGDELGLIGAEHTGLFQIAEPVHAVDVRGNFLLVVDDRFARAWHVPALWLVGLAKSDEGGTQTLKLLFHFGKTSHGSLQVAIAGMLFEGGRRHGQGLRFE